MALRIGRRYVVATFHPSPFDTPNSRSAHEGSIKQPTVVETVPGLRKLLGLDRPSFSPRFYEAELTRVDAGAYFFRPILRLRLSNADMGETLDDGSAPGIEETESFVRGEINEFAAGPEEPSLPSP